MNGWLPFVLLMAFAMLIASGAAFQVRLLLIYPASLTRRQLAAGWAVAVLAAAVGLGMAALAVLCLGWAGR